MNPPSWLPKTAAHVTQRGFSEEPNLQRLLFAFPLSAAASHLDARQKRREKKKPLPPPAQQPLNQNKAGAAAKSWEALLFNAQHPPAGPARPRVPGAGAGARGGQRGGCRAAEQEASSATSPRASSATPRQLVGQNQRCSSVHGHFAELGCSPSCHSLPAPVSLQSKAEQSKLNPNSAPATPSEPGTDPATLMSPPAQALFSP